MVIRVRVLADFIAYRRIDGVEGLGLSDYDLSYRLLLLLSNRRGTH